MIDAIVVLVLLVVDVFMIIAMPRMAQCPPKWSLPYGIRRTGPDVGKFTCQAPLARNCGESRGPYEHVPCPPTERFHSRIYCTGGSLPIIVDDRTVGCQR